MNFITKLNLCVPLPTDSQGKPPKREARKHYSLWYDFYANGKLPFVKIKMDASC